MEDSLGAASHWIEKLAKKLSSLITGRGTELNKLAEELLIVPKDLIPVFVEPNIQPYSPADGDQEEDSAFKVPVYKWLNEFINNNKQESDGRRQLFILADAGMGKTSILAMFKIAHINSFFLKKYRCEAIKLGGDSLQRIKEIPFKNETLLLLDSLDEDYEGFGRVSERIVDILDATIEFYRVIITCRTQFFPESEDMSYIRQDRVSIGNYKCPVKYLSLFDESQVNAFLSKKFDKDEKKIERAKDVLRQMHDLKFRPLVLTYIDDLIDSPGATSSYDIYEVIVNSWLMRECRKKNIHMEVKDLLRACHLIANHMMQNDVRIITEDQLKHAINNPTILENLNHVDIGGRSLLNKNSEGNFLFTHKSFQEFLLVQQFKMKLKTTWTFRNSTDMVDQFIRSTNMSSSKIVDGCFTNSNLSRANFCRAELPASIFYCADLTAANFSCSNLVGSNMARSRLASADFSKADLARVDFQGAMLDGANLSQSNLEDARLDEADLNRADLNSANLKKANLRGAKIIGADLRNANLENADLRNTILRGSRLENANFSNAKLMGADLSHASLAHADFTGADLTDALYIKEEIEKAILVGAKLNAKNKKG